MRDEGYGFIATEDEKDVLSHHTALQGLESDALKEGQLLEFEIEEESRSPRAVSMESSEKIER